MIHVLAMLYAGELGTNGLRGYEALILPILRSHGGRLLSAFVPGDSDRPDCPDEIHLIEFPTAQSFNAYRIDPNVEALADHRTRAIAASVVYVSSGILAYPTETKLLHLSQIPISSGLPKRDFEPIKPERFVGVHEGRLGKLAGMTQFGVNHVMLEPGSMSSLRHWHEAEDEFVYVLTGELTLIDDNGAHDLVAGSFAGFPAGTANAHHLENRSSASASFMVVGSRRPGEETIHYPDDDLGPIHK